jgi:translocation and assembly module TamB
MRRLLLLIAGVLVLMAIAVPTAAVYYLLFTEQGFRFIVSRIPHKVGSFDIQIVNPSGTVARGIRVEQLDIDYHLCHLTLKDIRARVELLPLILQNVRTRGASIDTVTVEVKRRKKPPIPATPTFLPRWLVVTADHLRLGNVNIMAYNGGHLEMTNFHASGIARHRQIRFFELGTQMGNARIDGSGTMEAYDPLRFDLQTKVHWTPPDQPAWALDLAGRGDLNILGVTIHTVTPFRADFTGQALSLDKQWHWQGNALVHDLDVTAWGGNRILGLLSGQLALKGNANGFALHGPLDSSGLKVGIFDTEFEGAFANHVLWAHHIGITHRGSGAHTNAGGTIEVIPKGPRLNLRGNWHDFQWPLVGKTVPFHSASGDFTVAGTWPYAIHASGMAQAKALPSMPATIDGALAKDRFTFGKADVDLYEGHAVLSGEAVWSPKDSWSVAGHLSDVNPAFLRADLPGKVNFSVAAQGQGFDGKGDFSVDVRDISGHLRGVPASGGGRFARRQSTWEFDKLRVQLGGTNLFVDGHLDDILDLRFAVNSKDLSLLSADSRGQLEGSGTVRGTSERPVVSASLRGNGIRHEGVGIEDFDANVDFDPDPQFESKVDLRVHNLSYQERSIDRVAFKLNGRSSNYTVHLDAKALGMSLAALANGPFNGGTWQGELRAVDIVGTESLRLKLDKPVGLLMSSDHVRAEWMCMGGQLGSMCADGEWTPKQWNATFTANKMPLSTFTAGLNPGVAYTGQINFVTRLSAVAPNPVQGSVRIDLTDAELSHRLSSGRTDHSKIGSGFITLNASQTALSGEVGLESGDVGTIRGTLVAQRTGESWQSLPVQGEIHAHTDQLGLITLYVPDIDRASGHLDGDMKVAGTLGTPLIDGDLRIADGEIDYYQVNLGLRQLAFAAKLTDNGVDFNGSTRIGSGVASAKGRLEWHNSLPYGKVNVEGTNLKVTDVPEAQIEASPNLEFNVNGRRIEATGSVKVPYAKIVPADLTGAVRSSSDEVIIGQETTDPSKRFEVVSNITLSLGDRVSIDTSGLKGRLTGNITVRSGYDEVTSGTGELSIEQGKYTTYARNLDIQRGRLIFSGGPVGNPGIDIRAVKEFPDVTAGVNVRGTLLQPRMSFFSDPSLTQSQIVSLLLAGGSLETAQNHQQGAGNELLAQGGAILAQQVGSHIGIQDVSLESDLTNETSLVLGRYLSPRLYVSYGIALTEQLNVLKLRYSLGDRWTIKTEVGQARGADLVYTIQR